MLFLLEILEMDPSKMKNNRHGQAAVLSDSQLEELLNECNEQYKLLFAITYYSSARISEVLKLEVSDIKGSTITFRKANTKTKTTRQLIIADKLQEIIDHSNIPKKGYLFLNQKQTNHISRQAVDKYLRKVCDYLGFEGISTHSFRRTSITKMFKNKFALKTIGQISGHKDLDNLVKYIEIEESEIEQAVNIL